MSSETVCLFIFSFIPLSLYRSPIDRVVRCEGAGKSYDSQSFSEFVYLGCDHHKCFSVFPP